MGNPQGDPSAPATLDAASYPGDRNVTPSTWTMALLLPNKASPIRKQARMLACHRRSSSRASVTEPQRQGHRRGDRPPGLQRCCSRSTPACRPVREVASPPRRLTDDGQRGVAVARPQSGRSRLAAASARSCAARPGPAAPAATGASPRGRGTSPSTSSTGTPDPALLPDLRPAIAAISSSSADERATSTTRCCRRWRRRCSDRWPFVPEEITVVDGAMDALDRIAQVVHRGCGDRVVVEHPTLPPLLDLLELLGADVIGVDLDDSGLSSPACGRSSAG